MSSPQLLVNAIGFGKFQIVLMLVCGLTYMADAMEIMLISYLTVVLQTAWSLDTVAQATLASTVFAGELVGAFAWGMFGDYFGRRWSFFLSCLIVAAAGLASAFAVEFKLLVGLATPSAS